MSTNGSRALSLREAAGRAGVTPATLRRWAREGLIPNFEGAWSPAAVGHARIVAALGLSPTQAESLSAADMQLLRYVSAVLGAGLPLVATLQLVRVYGQAAAQVADAEVRLFHLYVHEPLMRSGASGVEMAEEMLSLSRELLPLTSPAMDHVHQRYLRHFVEQDVVGHMESDLDGEADLHLSNALPSVTPEELERYATAIRAALAAAGATGVSD